MMPGQDWPRAIEAAIEPSDFFLACFSSRPVGKRGGFQAEFATRSTARRIRLDEIFMLPVRLDCCRVPRAVQRELEYIDLFPDGERGLRKLLAALRRRNAAA